MPHRRMLGWLQTAVMVALGGIGAAAGFTHTHDWAAVHGQTGWLAWADAVVIEGMAVAAGLRLRADRQAGRTYRFPAGVLAVAFIVQMTSQVALAEPTAAGWLLAAVPALGFLVVVKLALRDAPEPSPAAATETVPDRHPGHRPAPVPVESGKPGVALGKLPTAMRRTVAELAEQARTEGRTVRLDEVRERIGVPDHLATDLVDELNHNQHAA